MKYKAIIFDLDGVICHTDRYHYKAWKILTEKIGIYFDEEINNKLRGVSRMESLEIILGKYVGNLTDEEKQQYTEEKNNIYRELLNEMSEADLSVEVKDTLLKLKNMGMILAIGSSSKNAKTILNKIGLGNFFDAISDGNNISKSKPNPEVFEKASKFVGIPPKECLVVEDARVGLIAALANNMDCAAMGDGVNSNFATYNMETFSDLLKIVRE